MEDENSSLWMLVDGSRDPRDESAVITSSALKCWKNGLYRILGTTVAAEQLWAARSNSSAVGGCRTDCMMAEEEEVSENFEC